jgi:transposase
LASRVAPKAVLADKGYDADIFIKSLKARAIKLVIPPKSNRRFNELATSHSMPSAISSSASNGIKHYRGIATRYEKTARNFLAGLHLLSVLAWLK